MIENFDQIIEIAHSWAKEGRKLALATVIQTWGSAPRPVGAQLVVDENGVMMGSVSGGCVEGAVIEEALASMQTGQCKVLSFGVADEDAFAVGLACGGQIKILVEPVGVGQGWSRDELAALCRARASRIPMVVETNLENFTRKMGAPSEIEGAEELARADRSQSEEGRFIAVHNPPLRMAIIGGVHIAQPLIEFAKQAGYETLLIDPRGAFASAERFPDQEIIEDWPDEALETFGLDERTAVVTLTHDPKIDDPAIVTSLKSKLFYLGALGSKRTHAKRVDRLLEQGFTQADIARIHAPIGLDIGAKSPAEIAISIMAEITERLRKPETRR